MGHSVPREWAADHRRGRRVRDALGDRLAPKMASRVVGMDSWELSRQGRRAEAITRAAGPEEAVAFALPLAAHPGGLTPRPHETNCRRGVEHATSQRRKGRRPPAGQVGRRGDRRWEDLFHARGRPLPPNAPPPQPPRVAAPPRAAGPQTTPHPPPPPPPRTHPPDP